MSNTPYSAMRRADPGRLEPQSIRPLPCRGLLPDAVRRWVDVHGSMTRTIAEGTGASVSVTPLTQGPGQLAAWESRLLRTRQHRGYVREVVLSVAGKRVLSARTVSLLDDPAIRVIGRLGTRPLAELLFEDARWQRVSAPIPVIELARRRHGRACLWQYGVYPPGHILVTECFEPALLAGPVPARR
ncbi:MAG: chorismate lyase [Pseudomonadales bacterium]|jgi:chorismate-pyruvate lyase